MKKIIALALVGFFLATVVFAADKALTEKATELVNKGVAYIKAQGKDVAFAEFTKAKGKFSEGELYLFVVDFKGLVLAHGGNAKLVGKNQSELIDADGKTFIKEFINIASTKGEGWSDYKWSNPETKKIQQKTTFIKKIDGMDAFIGCGFYK